MSTPKIDFGIYSIEYTPPDKRTFPNWSRWMKLVITPLIWIYKVFLDFKDGADLPYFDISLTYPRDSKVIYNYKSYISLYDNNVGNNPELNPDLWMLISPLFIGYEQSTYFNSSQISLEYALNRYFRKELFQNGFVGFIQPDDPINPTKSDIYIQNIAPVNTSFVSFTGESGTSIVFTDKTNNAVSFTNTTFAGSTSYIFSINIPTLVYSSINSDPDTADSIIRRFVDRYLAAGIGYTIVTY